MRIMRNTSPDPDEIESRLRAERPSYQAPPGFTERVLSELPSVSRRHSTHKMPSFFPRLALGLAAFALAALLLSPMLRDGPEPIPIATQNGSSAPAPELDIPLPKITTEQVQALTWKLDQPLEQELRYVISDTRQAIQFVASNFLPEK